MFSTAIKMSAGKMHKNLMPTYQDWLSMFREIQIKQFIKEMSEYQKQSAANPGTLKSNRGRKPGNMKSTCHVRLREIF